MGTEKRPLQKILAASEVSLPVSRAGNMKIAACLLMVALVSLVVDVHCRYGCCTQCIQTRNVTAGYIPNDVCPTVAVVVGRRCVRSGWWGRCYAYERVFKQVAAFMPDPDNLREERFCNRTCVYENCLAG